MSIEPRRRIDVCARGDVPESGVRKFETEGLTLAVYNVGGEIFVTDDHCTHGPGSLSQGWLEGYEIKCEFHQGCYDVRTGAVTSPPPWIAIKTYEVTIEGDRIFIEA